MSSVHMAFENEEHEKFIMKSWNRPGLRTATTKH